MPESIRNQLSGPGAFYNAPDYLEKTKRELEGPLAPVSFRYEIDSKIKLLAKRILAALLLPITLLHIAAGFFVIIASNPAYLFFQHRPLNYSDVLRNKLLSYNPELKMKRIAVEVDGIRVDAMLLGKAANLNNKRWILYSNGNGEFYENGVRDRLKLGDKLDANILVYNYPGVGASGWFSTRDSLVKSYRAMLALLEEEIEAKEIIGYGFSIGGAVQGEAVHQHLLKKDVKYVFIKDRTFSELWLVLWDFLMPLAYILVKGLFWNINSANYSKVLNAPEIIMQTADDNDEAADDGVIAKLAALLHALEKDEEFRNNSKKAVITLIEGHNDPLMDMTFKVLVKKIKEYLR